MSDRPRLRVVVAWHMHQPEYRDLISGEYQQPWTYLHGIKDYVDMAALLERHPSMHAVVNFAPVLLEQIADYAAQINAFLNNAGTIRDPLLAALEMPALPVDQIQRAALIDACLRINRSRLVEPFPHFVRLMTLADSLQGSHYLLEYIDAQYIADLVTWYHLGWLGETVRRTDKRVQRLIEKGRQFTLRDRRELLGIIGEQLTGVLGRYQALEAEGRIELSMTPYGHPILPLLLDFKSARESIPDVQLPSDHKYAAGEQRARWHIERGMAVFEQHFGHRPSGCWPAEGGVSEQALRLLSEHGFKWTASGEGVFRNSVKDTRNEQNLAPDHPYKIAGVPGMACFFRDDGLSDLIGFTYATWHGEDAAADLIAHLERIDAAGKSGEARVVSIILDGENAWEHFPANGFYFLNALYERLSNHPRIKTTTFSAYLNKHTGTVELSKLVAGSWVHGTFSAWIGSVEKNRAWEMLCAAKRAYDRVVSSGALIGEARELAERQLAICEGSDWFWWFGDYNPAASVQDFDRLYRRHLGNLYQLIGVEPPDELSHVISHGGGHPSHGGVMRSSQVH